MKDRSATARSRRSSLHALLTQRNEDASDILEILLDEPDMALDAIRGYAMVENAAAPSVLLRRYERMSPELRRAVIETLADQIIGSASVSDDEWLEVTVDLTKFAGRQIELSIENRPNDWRNEWAYWNRVYIVSE